MASVWLVFIGTAFMLAVGGVVALRATGMKAPVFHHVGTFLLVMAAGTAAFSALLPTLGWTIWAGSNVSFVFAITTAMTVRAVRKARRLEVGQFSG